MIKSYWVAPNRSPAGRRFASSRTSMAALLALVGAMGLPFSAQASGEQALAPQSGFPSAATLSDADVAGMADTWCQEYDTKNAQAIAPADSKYVKRLNAVAKDLPSSVNGKPAAYKVYMTKQVNAFAMANGCIRVYSGLMDLMNDDELRAVLGHEIGHVALGHSRKAMQTEYAVVAARQAAASSGNAVVAKLSKSEIGAIGQKVISAQFSQSQESAADDYCLTGACHIAFDGACCRARLSRR